MNDKYGLWAGDRWLRYRDVYPNYPEYANFDKFIIVTRFMAELVAKDAKEFKPEIRICEEDK